MASTFIKTITLDFTTLELYSDYIISTIQEGTIINESHFKSFFTVFDTYYKNIPFGFIANRKYDYTVDPLCYTKTTKYFNFVGMAVLCHSKKTYDITTFENKFYHKPLAPFYTLEECIDWVKEIVANSKKNAGL